MGKRNKDENDNKPPVSDLGQFLQLGASVPISIILGFLIGLFLDNKLNTTPTFVIIFTIVGVLAAYKNIFNLNKKDRKDDDGTAG